MNPETIDTIEPTEKANAWIVAAAALRDLSDRCATLADVPAANCGKDPFITISILPGPIGGAPETAGIIDAVGMALLGKPGGNSHRNDDGICYRADGQVGRVLVSIHGTVPAPRSEADELRAEVAALKAKLADGAQ